MFKEIFLFEIKYRSKRAATWLYYAAFLILGFLSVSQGWTPATEKVHHNSPFIIADCNVFFSMMMMLVCSAIMGVPLYRDIEHGTKNYYLSYPITKPGYFWGRFFGSFVFVLLIGTSISLGCYLGSLVGPIFDWVPAERIGENHWDYYIQPFLTMAVPNLFLASAIFFGLVAFFRDVKVIYTGSILLLIGYLLANFLTRDLDNRELVKILDPFAMNTLALESRFYTPVERNTLLVPVQGAFLVNRLLWSGVAFVILMATYFGFSFKRFFGGSSKKQRHVEVEETIADYGAPIPKVAIHFAKSYYRKIMFSLAKIELLNILRDNYFKAILLGGVVFLFVDFWIGNTTFGVSALPLTVNLMQYKNYDYVLFIFIIIIFYTGETVHRDKSTGFALINDALPTPDWVLYGSKLLGLTGLAFFLAIVPLFAGVIVQVLKGYFEFRFDVYFIELCLISFVQYLQIVMLSFAVHVLVNNKFAGHGIGLIIWIVMFLLRNVGEMGYNLFFYSYAPGYMWSDMDGINSMWKGVFFFNLYWMLFGALLLVIAAAFYTRGVFSGRKERFRSAKSKYNGRLKMMTAIFLLGFLLTGAYNYYNVSVLNNYLTSEEARERQAEYEKKLKKYEALPQPKVNHLYADIAIYPKERRVHTSARIELENKTDKPISDLHLNGEGLERFSVKINGKLLTNISYPLIYKRGKFNFLRPANDTAKYRIYHLDKPLMPGEKMIANVESDNVNKGFTNDMSGTDILSNGTFFAGGLPSMGYDPNGELFSDEKRKKYKLKPKDEELPPYTDAVGVKTLLFNDDADFVTMEFTVSTDKGQIPIAPGKEIKRWEKDGRVYINYAQTTPKVDLFFDVISARYEVLKKPFQLQGAQKVGIELYYHKTHNTNLDRFLKSYEDGLTWFSKWYGNYQFDQLRLLEFPKYRSFAQSFPNTVSYSESFGYTADFKPDDFDYGYYVTAHELAHQWWGHQVTPNRTLGSNLISEALAEYTALILSEKRYGKDNMKRFLKQELDDYLRGRANESKKENVFIDCNRPYQWYNKGSLILYGLRDLIGEDTLNKALKEFRDQFAFKETPPFAGSHDLYNAIDKHVPDSLKYYLQDTWKKITLYENKVLDVKVTPGKGDEKIVTLTVSTRKMYADAKGEEKPAASMDDYIDIGVFAPETTDKDGRKKVNVLYLQKHKLKAGTHKITVKVKGEVTKAGIDPLIKLIDRIPDDNIKDL
ncbi:ABC transporter permease/M1 family aminopeptidase [Flavobacterium silvaticum]|uniref:Peptidase M1 membrane alanine aminopeptidase domain-containing protein n=1 Tax=Flavobacterium silvaticum TaxID=1852020 RepID=A0A972JEE4_9FLAO|nr:M1 family aminopeptidase [Flavobacterium silvaticum]NMH26789.1 hypothetical protein [Flavobacterium silvaticum]